jgi:hypothetical protein
MIFLSFSCPFWSSSCASRGCGFELKTLYFLLSMDSSRERLRNQVVSSWFDCDESLTCQCLNSNMRHFGCFTFILVSCGESRLLVSWCAGGRCGMADSDEDRSKSRRPGVEDRRWSHKLDTRWPDD